MPATWHAPSPPTWRPECARIHRFREIFPPRLENKPLPVDAQLALASQESPVAATVGKVSQGLAATAPLAVAGALPTWGAKLVAAGFSAQMISQAPQLARDLGTELGKNPEDRDPDKLTSLISDAIQTGVFAPLAGAHSAGDFLESKLDPTTYVARQLADQLKTADLKDTTPAADVKAAPLSASAFLDQPAPDVQTPELAASAAAAEAPPANVIPMPAAVEAATPPAPRLIPLDVSPEHIASMANETERPPDVLDDIENVTSEPVKFAEPDYAPTIDDARQNTFTKAGRPSAATGRLDQLISADEGMPADKVLAALQENPKYADWTRDDLAQAIIGAHAARENPPADPNARLLAEQQARDNLFNQANKATRPGVESVPVEQLFLGDTFKVNGQPMTVAEHPVDADTGKVSGVRLEGAYGSQHLAAGESVHMDAGSLRDQPAQMVGMGGAIPSEFENSTAVPMESKPIGISKAAVASQRTARGEEQLAPYVRSSFSGDVWPRTVAKVRENPDLPEQFVQTLLNDQLEGVKRSLTDDDVAMLDYRHADLSYDRAKFQRMKWQAEDDAKHFPNRAEELPYLNGQIAKIDDQLDTLDKVTAPLKTNTAQGLSALQHMVGDDYSLARMEATRTRDFEASAGRSMNPDEHAAMMKELVDIRAKMKDATEREQKAKAIEDEERSKQMADEAIKAQLKVVEQTPGYNKQAQSLADRIVAYWNEQETKAWARIKARNARFNSAVGGVDPTLLADATIIGIAKITRGLNEKAPWLKAMVDDFGEHAIPYLNKIWNGAQKKIQESIARGSSGRIALEVKKRVEKNRRSPATAHRSSPG